MHEMVHALLGKICRAGCLLLLATPLPAYSDTIVLTDLPARVFQRDIGGTTADIPLSGTYDGATPTAVEARVVRHGTDTEVTTWTQLTDATIGSGSWSGTLPSVPQGGWYDVQVREEPAHDLHADGSNPWGVGILIAIWGQSNSLWMNESSAGGYDWGGYDYVPNPLLRQYGGQGCTCGGCAENDPVLGSWVNPSADGDVCLGNDLVSSLDIPIAFLAWSVSGSVLLAQDRSCACGGWYWNGSQYRLARASVQCLSSTVEFVIWWQGFSDGICGATQSDYYAGLQLLYYGITTDLRGSKLLYIVNDGATAAAVNAAINQAVSTGYGYAGADASDIPYVHYPDIQGLGAGDVIGHRLATSIMGLLQSEASARPPSTQTGIGMSCRPNPFNARVVIDIAGSREPVDVAIFDVRGKEIAVFRNVTAGSLLWNAVGLPDGVYFLRSSVGNRTYATAKVLLQK